MSVLVHGVHRAGPDEPRLIAAARKLAGMGLTVVTPRIEELTRYDIERPALDRVRAAARWTLDHSGLVPTGRRIGLMGICFGGGLAVACAGDPELSDRIAYTFSLGGHARLDEVLAYLASGQGPDLLPDVYGQAVVLRQLAPLGLPPAQVGPLREALRQFLDGDETASRAAADALPEPARSLMGRVLDRDARALAATLAEWVPRYRPDPSLSPLLCPPPRGPVFLLHAAGDRVIPPGQSEALARHLASQVSVRVLVTGMFAHVDPGPGSIPEALELAAFLTDLLGQ